MNQMRKGVGSRCPNKDTLDLLTAPKCDSCDFTRSKTLQPLNTMPGLPGL